LPAGYCQRGDFKAIFTDKKLLRNVKEVILRTLKLDERVNNLLIIRIVYFHMYYPGKIVLKGPSILYYFSRIEIG
jgi:hypothetical protein